MTTIVNIRKVNKQRPFFDIYIGRATRFTEFTVSSKWANPFPKSDPKCLENYRKFITQKIDQDPETYNLEELRGKVLGCWCKPGFCHGDVLIELMEESK